MAANEYLNPNQLQLFDSAGSIMSRITQSGDLGNKETLPEMWDRKLEESKDPYSPRGNLYENMKTNGWDTSKPLRVGLRGDWTANSEVDVSRGGEIASFNAHHRLASAAAIEKETGKPFWVPMQYEGSRYIYPSPPVPRLPSGSSLRKPSTMKPRPGQMKLPGLEEM